MKEFKELSKQELEKTCGGVACLSYGFLDAKHLQEIDGPLDFHFSFSRP